MPKEILFTFQPSPLQYHDDLETMDTIYRGRCRMDEPATTGSYSLSPRGKRNPAGEAGPKTHASEHRTETTTGSQRQVLALNTLFYPAEVR